MTLMLTPEHDQAIRSHGERAFPHECCGFLLGKVVEGVYRVARVMPAANSRGEEEKHNRFTITPEASYLAEKAARKEKLDIIGHYHSHPNHPARPSQYDLDHATWPGSAFAIVSVMKGRAELMTSWLLAADRSRFDPQAIEIEQHQET